MGQKKYIPKNNPEHKEQINVTKFESIDTRRGLIVNVLLGVLVIVVFGSVIYSIVYGNEKLLFKLINMIQAPLLMLIGYYFGKQKV